MQIASATSLAVAHRRRDFAVWFPWEPIIIAIVLATWQRKKKKTAVYSILEKNNSSLSNVSAACW